LVAGKQDNREILLEELNRRLAELEGGRRRPSPVLDRLMSRLGEAEMAVGVVMLVFAPFDAFAAILTSIGGATWAYERFIKEPREAREEIERRRQLDLVRSELDRLKRQ
jgi:hypothetical protein